MKKILLIILIVGMISITGAYAADEENITNAIEDGVAWLVDQQETDGSWPAYWEDVATTGLGVLKLCDYANDLQVDPFSEDFIYNESVIDGLNYLFLNLSTVDIGMQNHTTGATGTMDNPDVNANGFGIYASGHSYPFDVYDTGIVLSAISACGSLDRVANVSGNVTTHGAIAQDMVDWLAWAQSDSHKDNGSVACGEGGWSYGALDNNGDGNGTSNFGPDNSNSGYAVLGLAYAQDSGLIVPDWVKTELNAYIECIQETDNNSVNFGGSWYEHRGDVIGVNILKTGNLIFEMAFVGDTPDTPRVVNALAYLEAHWNDTSGANQPPGWGGDPAQYQTMFTTMKGLEYMGVDTFGDSEIDWFEDFTDAIVDQQEADGSWILSSGRGNPVIITEWALLVLEKASPPPPVKEVFVDIKPGSCPNSFNTKNKGVLPVAVLGIEDFDVTTIDPATIVLSREGIDENVSLLRWSFEDVATPFEGELCECHELTGDGYLDLSLKFDTQELVDKLNLTDIAGETKRLILTGKLKEEFGGTAINGEDCLRILAKK